jgi:capsular polysaccharide biosynthesis protein
MWVDEGLTVNEERAPADVTAGLVSLAFIKAALRRSAWLWCATAVAGLLIGSALYLRYPPAYHATASVLVLDTPGQDPTVQVQTDANLAQSQTVAGRVVKQLGLNQTVSSFQAAYSVAVISDTVLMFNVGAPTGAEAVRRASALATAFLQYRAQYMRAQYQQLVSELDQQYNAAQQQLNSINAQISQLGSQPSSPAQQTKINNLLTQRGTQNQIVQYAAGNKATAKTATNTVIADSQVLNSATPIPRSHIKGAGLYVLGGLFGGLAVGVAIVVISALVSDRLRRRDDVAAALGAPVRLSVGGLRRRRWWPGLRRRSARRKLDMRRVVVHLQALVPGSSRGPARLAVIAVDDPFVVAQATASMAESCTSKGQHVVVADLSGGAQLARLLATTEPGIHAVGWNGVQFTLALPDPDDAAPVGPWPGPTSPVATAQPSEAVVSACSSADLLVTLATLDPAFGADHLATWATDVVAVVTAGKSSVERVRVVGEMIRLAGLRVDSAILIGADKGDESLGVAPEPDGLAQVEPVSRP